MCVYVTRHSFAPIIMTCARNNNNNNNDTTKIADVAAFVVVVVVVAGHSISDNVALFIFILLLGFDCSVQLVLQILFFSLRYNYTRISAVVVVWPANLFATFAVN